MYSVVLMMALSGGTEAVDFGHRKACSGCSGAVVASSCSGTVVCSGSVVCTGAVAYSGCVGSHRSHGCSGVVASCSGSSCSGSCHGGGLFSRLHSRRASCHGSCTGVATGCYGSTVVGCVGSMGCVGSAGCVGSSGCSGVIVVPANPGTPETPKVMPKKVGSIASPATIVVSLPAGAKLTVDGLPTTSTSAQRTLVTPAIDTETTYVYTLQAQVNGQTLTNEVHIRGGQVIQTQFSFPTQSVASR